MAAAEWKYFAMLTPYFRSVRLRSARIVAPIALVALSCASALSIGHPAVSQETAQQPAQASKVAVFTVPSTKDIHTPESLKLTSYDATVTVRVTMMASGRIKAEVTKSSGHPALDDAVKNTCLKIKFKPAMQDGKAVDTVQRFNFHLTNHA